MDVLDILIPIQHQEFEQAVATATGLAIRLPNHPIAHILEGLAQVAAGDTARAKSAFQKALRLDPDLELARSGLDNLEI